MTAHNPTMHRLRPDKFAPSIGIALLLTLCWQNCAVVDAGRRWERAYDMRYVWPIDNTVDENVCARNMERIYHGHVVAPIPPDISGDWTSSQCEVRPGPEYVLRKYRFENRRFTAHQFYYADADCSEPLFSLVARGSFNVQWESWIVPGGTEVDYKLNHVTVMPYTELMANVLSGRVNKTCPGFVSEQWQAFERHEIFNYVEFETNDLKEDESDDYIVMDRDCTAALDFSIHELQLVRLEHERHHRGLMKKLFLGDIHTDRKQRQLYRPTSYQEPLLATETFGCSVCRVVANSDDYYPPSLHRRTHGHHGSLAGEWFSERCEIRPNGIFVTRRLMFSNNNRTWDGYYYHFADALCRKPIFTIYARGTYVTGSPSPIVDHARHYDFKVVQLKLKADHQGIADTLNQPGVKCGIPGRWSVGAEQDLSITKGCRPLGLRVPHVEYELMKVEKDHHKFKLFIGQRPSDGKNPITPDDRPTSFQPALIKCGPGRSNNAYYGYQVAEQQVEQQNSNSASYKEQQSVLFTATLLTLLYTVL